MRQYDPGQWPVASLLEIMILAARQSFREYFEHQVSMTKILATGTSVREYLVQQVAMTEYDPGHLQVFEEYLLQKVSMTENDPGHLQVCEKNTLCSRWP